MHHVTGRDACRLDQGLDVAGERGGRQTANTLVIHPGERRNPRARNRDASPLRQPFLQLAVVHCHAVAHQCGPLGCRGGLRGDARQDTRLCGCGIAQRAGRPVRRHGQRQR